ncbi:MAG: hypothetical protein NT178_06900 [Proteobacteria bacterium]|nr:hypothetical protein [Pseudomonadota bacterium]
MVTPTAYSFSSFSLEIDGGGVEENEVQPAEEIPALREQILFDNILGTLWQKRGAIQLVFDLFPEKSHSTVEMMKGETINTIDNEVEFLKPRPICNVRIGN